MCNVVEDSPRLHMDAVGGNLVVINAVEEEREWLEKDQGCHDPVYPKNLLWPSFLQDKHPETAREEEQYS